MAGDPSDVLAARDAVKSLLGLSSCRCVRKLPCETADLSSAECSPQPARTALAGVPIAGSPCSPQKNAAAKRRPEATK